MPDLGDLGFGNGFLDMTPKARETKGNVEKSEFINI